MKEPVIIINHNDANNAFRSIGGIFGIIIGIGLILISNSGREPTTSGIVFGAFLVVAGLIKIISSSSASNKAKEEFALKIDAESIYLDGMITDEEETMIIPLDEISNVKSNVSQGGSSSLTIYLNNKDLVADGYIDLDIALAEGDWLKTKSLINSLINKSYEERQIILKDHKE